MTQMVRLAVWELELASLGSPLDVSYISMLRQEEFVQQTVHLQQTFAVQNNRVALHHKKSPVLQRLHGRGKTHADVHAEFFLKVIATDSSQFQLQHELANQAFIVGGGQRAIDRQPS